MDTKKVVGVLALALTCAAASAATPAKGTTTHPVVRRPVSAVHRAVPAKAPVRAAVTTPIKRVPVTTVTSATPRPAETIGGLPWYHVADGFALAKKQNKPIMVDVYTDWCGWCKVLDRETFPNPAVTAILGKSFVLVKANAEDNGDGQRLATQNRVDGFPTVMFFEPSGKLKAVVHGFVPPTEFVADLHEFLGDAPAPIAEKKPDTVSVHPSAPEGTTVSMPSTESADPKPVSEMVTPPATTPPAETHP